MFFLISNIFQYHLSLTYLNHLLLLFVCLFVATIYLVKMGSCLSKNEINRPSIIHYSNKQQMNGNSIEKEKPSMLKGLKIDLSIIKESIKTSISPKSITIKTKKIKSPISTSKSIQNSILINKLIQQSDSVSTPKSILIDESIEIVYDTSNNISNTLSNTSDLPSNLILSDPNKTASNAIIQNMDKDELVFINQYSNPCL